MIDIHSPNIAWKITFFCRLLNDNTGKNAFTKWYLSKYGFIKEKMLVNGDLYFLDKAGSYHTSSGPTAPHLVREDARGAGGLVLQGLHHHVEAVLAGGSLLCDGDSEMRNIP